MVRRQDESVRRLTVAGWERVFSLAKLMPLRNFSIASGGMALSV